MSDVSLGTFIVANRSDILARCAAKMHAKDSGPVRASATLGVPQFLDQLVNELGPDAPQHGEIGASALRHGRELFADGFTVGQLVHDYGNVCQSISDLALETGARLATADFRTLNRCLDDAIAAAVAEYLRQDRTSGDDDAIRIRNLVYIVDTAFEVVREGKVGVSGTTGDLLQRSLASLKALVDHSPK